MIDKDNVKNFKSMIIGKIKDYKNEVGALFYICKIDFIIKYYLREKNIKL